MKFSKTHLIVVSTASVFALFLAGAAWGNVMNPDRVKIAELQSKRAQNELLITELKAEHEKATKLRDQISGKLDSLNNHLTSLEQKGFEARAANADLTKKIENGGKE